MQLLLRISAPRHANPARTALAAAALPTATVLARRIGAAIALQSGVRCSSSNQWKQRQSQDYYARVARVKGLKSRAAFKLIDMDKEYRLFKVGQTVVDLGYAPGSWSQVAADRTNSRGLADRKKPHGLVVGIDLIPAQPPRGVSTIQGNFLAPAVQNLAKEYLIEMDQRRKSSTEALPETTGNGAEIIIADRPSYIDAERAESTASSEPHEQGSGDEDRLVDVVLSDMSEPWEQVTGFSIKTLTNPYRMMNTSGIRFRDHAGSMDLCLAALQFASDTLRAGGHFVCKFYQGAEDKAMEMRLREIFEKVHRGKPDSSRNESREAYFVALRRKADVKFQG